MNSMSNQDSQITVGLDIGSKKIKCAIGQVQDNQKRVNLLGFSEIESSGIKKGIIINRDELIDKIEQVINGFNVSFSNYSIFTGTKGYERMAVIALQSKNKTTHFAKIALDKPGLARIKNERNKLYTYNYLGLDSILVPKLVKGPDNGVLVVTNETTQEMVHEGKLTNNHYSAYFRNSSSKSR